MVIWESIKVSKIHKNDISEEFRIEKDLLKRVYVDFDYLFVDVDFFQLDENTEKTMDYFSDELRNIADKIITNFDLK